MKLLSFEVKNFRSINDSGNIEIRKRTALVGRNESGKTNLLIALKSIKPPEGMKEHTYVKDFPRERHHSEFSDNHDVVVTEWELTESERKHLATLFPRAKSVNCVNVGRRYKPTRWVSFVDLPPISIDNTAVEAHFKKLNNSIKGSMKGKDKTVSESVKAAIIDFHQTLKSNADDPDEWAANVQKGINTLNQILGANSISLSQQGKSNLESITIIVKDILNDEDAAQKARNWIGQRLPVFIYLDEYPELEGHQDIHQFIHRKQQNSLTQADNNFLKLMKVAGLDPEQMNQLLAKDHEERQQLANRAGAVVTKKIKELWTDRQLKVRFNLDASHFDTLISDPSSVYDVEINLNERSHGFQWFFSFYITFAADTVDGPAENAILLLDEPGLHLHAIAQGNLLDHFNNDFDNQIIYTTHSPFMIPIDDLSSVRTVNIDPDNGTTVTNDPTGDDRTLFPIQTAIGYYLSQTLFIGDKNLIVEGVSDFWYLSAVSEYLNDLDKSGLPVDLVITPAGGAQKVSYMVALLTSQKLKVLLLLDTEKQAQNTADDLIKSKLIRDDNIIFTNVAFSGSKPSEADIEDILDPDTFNKLVEESYKVELANKTLSLNSNIPRIVKRYEEAFRGIGIEFHKTRPAKLFIRRIAEDPDSVMTSMSRERFKSIFKNIASKLDNLCRKDNKPYN